MKRIIATKHSWINTPMPLKRESLKMALSLSFLEFERIKVGFIPQRMEDRWFIFFEEGWLYFHRSWTGFCNYQLRFEPKEHGFLLVESWINRDENQFRGGDLEAEQENVLSLLSYFFDIQHTTSR